MLGYGALIVGLQIFCLIHCMQRNRHRSWILLIVFAPLIGSIVYLYTEYLPDYQRRGGTRNANPLRYRPAANKEIDRLQEEVRYSDTVQSRENLADEYIRQEMYSEAAALYRECLAGPLENDPTLLYKLAEACYGLQNYPPAIEALHRIRALSDYRPAKVRLLLARCYDGEGQFDKATNAFEQALKVQTDLEVKYRYALFLQTRGEAEKARTLLEEILAAAERMPQHTREQNQTWLDLARQQANGQNSKAEQST